MNAVLSSCTTQNCIQQSAVLSCGPSHLDADLLYVVTQRPRFKYLAITADQFSFDESTLVI